LKRDEEEEKRTLAFADGEDFVEHIVEGNDKERETTKKQGM